MHLNSSIYLFSFCLVFVGCSTANQKIEGVVRFEKEPVFSGTLIFESVGVENGQKYSGVAEIKDGRFQLFIPDPHRLNACLFLFHISGYTESALLDNPDFPTPMFEPVEVQRLLPDSGVELIFDL